LLQVRAPHAGQRACGLTVHEELRYRAEVTKNVRLFSYGTLQLPQVQRTTYGRLLEGAPDALPGFVLEPLEIADPEVVRISGERVHQIARRTGRPSDRVTGTVFTLTLGELADTDAYEVSAYTRILVRLASGEDAFVYAARLS
jgi:hypothetical protein